MGIDMSICRSLIDALSGDHVSNGFQNAYTIITYTRLQSDRSTLYSVRKICIHI